ncbi:hypothetical protein [Guyparkeria sp.]
MTAGTRPLADLLAEANHLAASSHAKQIGA